MIQNYFDMVIYLKQETSSGPIFFEGQWNDNSTDNIELFEPPFEFNVITN